MPDPFTPEQEERIEQMIEAAIRKNEHDIAVGIRQAGRRI